MKATYDCLGCGHLFTIEITDQEARSSLNGDRSDNCPKCALPVGSGRVHCRTCLTLQRPRSRPPTKSYAGREQGQAVLAAGGAEIDSPSRRCHHRGGKATNGRSHD
jgi:hypothetical protein